MKFRVVEKAQIESHEIIIQSGFFPRRAYFSFAAFGLITSGKTRVSFQEKGQSLQDYTGSSNASGYIRPSVLAIEQLILQKISTPLPNSDREKN